MSREASISPAETFEEMDDYFDFGEPEILVVEISPERYLSLREPSVSDLIEINKISANKKISEIEAIVQMICILHHPDEGSRKLTSKDCKRLTAKQLKNLGKAINELLGQSEEEDDAEEGDESETED
jgi:hypothetical protein